MALKKGKADLSRRLAYYGGSSKGFGQVQTSPGSLVAADGIEVGAGNKVPLYLFGFLY